MGSWASGKTVTLHYTLEALTLGAARDLDAITSLEQRNGELLAHLINFTVVRGEFTHELRRGLEARLNSVSDFSLVGTLRLLRAEANLDSRVAIRVIGSHHDNWARPGFNDGDGYLYPIVIEDPRHTDFFSNQSGHSPGSPANRP